PYDSSPDQDPKIRSQKVKDGGDQISESCIRLRQDGNNDQQSRNGYNNSQKDHPPVSLFFFFHRKRLKEQPYLAQRIQDRKGNKPVPAVQQDPGRGCSFP